MKKAFATGDRVIVKNATTTFYTRNQALIRGKTGVIVEHRPDWVIPKMRPSDVAHPSAAVAWSTSTSCGLTK